MVVQLSRRKWAFIIGLLLILGLSTTYVGVLKDSDVQESRTRWSNLRWTYAINCSSQSTNIGDLEFLPAEPVVAVWESSRVLRGEPTQRFKDNLLNDTWYITAWSNAGFTNQFISYVNMVYLGIISDRVPIIPPFGPDHHITKAAGALSFGKVFTLTSARQAIGKPLLEWKDVKALPSETSIQRVPAEERETLGCWSGRNPRDPRPSRVESVVDNLGLDISYTRIPAQARHDPHNPGEDTIEFHRLVPYIFPERPFQPEPNGFPLMEASPLGQRLSPDNRISCFDHLYYLTSSSEGLEWRYSWSPAWRRVATHLHFTDDMVDLTKGYLARAFQVDEDKIPPFIAVHARRDDFSWHCEYNHIAMEKCLPPLEVFKVKVDAIRRDLLEKQNREVKEVVLMSDEVNSTFWQEAQNIGWKRLNHLEEQTWPKYGEWYAPVIDQVAQSMAAGFVGTEGSTFSLVASRRVEDWNNGLIDMVPRP